MSQNISIEIAYKSPVKLKNIIGNCLQHLII